MYLTLRVIYTHLKYTYKIDIIVFSAPIKKKLKKIESAKKSLECRIICKMYKTFVSKAKTNAFIFGIKLLILTTKFSKTGKEIKMFVLKK